MLLSMVSYAQLHKSLFQTHGMPARYTDFPASPMAKGAVVFQALS